jgi:hypothetical protein
VKTHCPGDATRGERQTGIPDKAAPVDAAVTDPSANAPTVSSASMPVGDVAAGTETMFDSRAYLAQLPRPQKAAL